MRIIYQISLLIVILFTSCKKDFENALGASLQKKDYVPVVVKDLTGATKVIPIYAMGRVSTDTQTKLSFKTGGYISALYADEGDYVRKGKLLGTLRTQEIDAQVLKATRALQKAERDLERIKAMYEDSVATLENVQDLSTLVDVSKADLEIARFNQEYSRIVSPISGRIINRAAESNELVSPGQPIFVIASSGRGSYVMTTHISDKDINLINYGTKADIEFDAFQDEIFRASVNRISENADPMTGTFEVELNMDDRNKRMRNALIGRVTLYPDQQYEFIKIPMSSLVEGKGNQASIFVPTANNQYASKIEIDIQRFDDEFVWINKDDIPAEKIITVGSSYLKNGQKIKITEL